MATTHKFYRWTMIVRVAAAVVLTVFLSGCTKTPPRQVILVLLDAARPDHFSCYGYSRQTTPEMDRLAEKGVVFQDCFTQGTYTQTAVPCLVYSRYYTPSVFPYSPFVPLYHPDELFQDLDSRCISIPRVFELHGFLTAAISAHDFLKPETRLGKEFMLFYDLLSLESTDKKTPYPRAEAVIDFTLEWVKKNINRDYFLYVHLMDTHFPHYFEDDARSFFGTEADTYTAEHFIDGGWLKNTRDYDEEDVRYLNALYDGSLRYADRQLGRLFRFLQESGRLDTTLLVFTSDHGELLLERQGKIGHGTQWYEQVARIPLIIHCPQKLKPARFKGFAEMVDIGPTILSLMGMSYPRGKTTDGVDLLEMASGSIPERRAVLIKNGIRTRQYKCLFDSPDTFLLSRERPDPLQLVGELYNLEEDREEKVNIFESKTAIVSDLLEDYRKKMMGLYQRFLASRLDQTRTPASPFAVSSLHFETDLDITEVSSRMSIEQMKAATDTNGWFQSRQPDDNWLFARQEARPLTVSFPVPNGRYHLLVDMNGSCYLKVGEEIRLIRSRPFQHTLPWLLKQVDFGPVEIKDNRFEATVILKSRRPWFGLRFFGFIPEGAGDADSPEYKKRLERLRALGYIK